MAEWRWEELVAHATLGTGRRPDVAVHTVGGQPVEAPTPEQRLLAAAAAMGAGIRASVTPTHVGTPDGRWVAPAEEPLAVAPTNAVQLLDAVLSGVLRGPLARTLVVWWLEQAARAGWRVPADRIGGVLDTSPTPLPSEAVAALGRRGRWLAGMGASGWAHRLVDVEGAASALATSEGRVAVRAATVRLWADGPDRGRAVLEQGWDRWALSKRACVVAAVEGLAGPVDEPWLTAALADAEPVALAAARVLRQVPGSALVQRMGARLGQVMTVEGQRVVPVEVAVRPTPVDLRDATTPVASRAIGWWAQEVRRAAPLQAWVDLCGSRAAAITAQTADPAVLLDVVEAAVGLRDVGWATDLLPGLLAGTAAPRPSPSGTGLVIDTAAQTAWTAALASVLELLDRAPLGRSWPAELTTQVMAWIGGHPRPGDALTGLTDILVAGPGPDLDDRLANARPAGLFADQIAVQIRTIQTARSLRRAIAQMAAAGASAPGGAAIDPADATTTLAADAESGHEPADAESGHEPADAESGHEPADAESGHEPADVTTIDHAEAHATDPADAEAIGPDDATTTPAADAETGREAGGPSHPSAGPRHSPDPAAHHEEPA